MICELLFMREMFYEMGSFGIIWTKFYQFNQNAQNFYNLL